MAALRDRSAAAWMTLLDKRWMRTEWPYGSGVWGKLEWVYPGIDHGSIVSFAEGGSNLLWAERYGKDIGLSDLWIKLCGNSHTGSFKDLGMTVLVSAVREMIASTAAPCAPSRAPAPATPPRRWRPTAPPPASPRSCFLPKDKVSIAQLLQPLANGALVLSLDTDFDGCMRIVQGSHRRTAPSTWPTR